MCRPDGRIGLETIAHDGAPDTDSPLGRGPLGDTVLELNQECGGHRLVGKLTNCPLVELHASALPFDIDRFNIDVVQTLELIERQNPRFVVEFAKQLLRERPGARRIAAGGA